MEFPSSIENKFRYILVAAKRVHQLQAGSKARVQSLSNKLIVIAQQEVMGGLVPFRALPFPGDGQPNALKVRQDENFLCPPLYQVLGSFRLGRVSQLASPQNRGITQPANSQIK